MAKISVLDKRVAELIAAGEVVERPSSVIKELVENSVDAGSAVITVEIRNGGTTFMRVTDNGSGISSDEVETAFLRHATSKINERDDLDAIMTLGFRGEALASISAVSKIEMLTRTEQSAVGVRYSSNGAENPTIEEAGCPVGTTIIVRDLFFNTPARMKFLKKDVTEGNAIAGIIDKMALSHPEISFRFIRDGKETLHTPGDNKLSSAIYSVFGKDFTDGLMPVEYELEGLKIKGFATTPSASRPNRSMQNFFINGRFIKSRTASVALDEAYKGSLMTGKFPACVLHVSIPYEAIDVNVHPAKLEVRFINERPIFDIVYHGVKSALSRGDKTKEMTFKHSNVQPFADAEKAPQVTFAEKPNSKAKSEDSKKTFFDKLSAKEENTKVKMPQDKSTNSNEFAPNSKSSQSKLSDAEAAEDLKQRDYIPQIERIIDTVPLPEQRENNDNAQEHKAESEVQAVLNIDDIYSENEKFTKLVGEAFGTYIVIEYGDKELMLIDKHAAHERMLYEKLKREETGKESQTLLEPITITLDKNEYSAVMANLEVLDEAGFEVEDFGVGTVIVRSVPLILDGADIKSTVMEIAGYLADMKSDISTEHLDWIYHNVACRAAIKSGDTTSREELIALAKKLEENPEIRYCPHGRPVSIIIKKYDIEKQFGRV